MSGLIEFQKFSYQGPLSMPLPPLDGHTVKDSNQAMKSPREITRRKFLGSSATLASTLALAGCAGKPSTSSSRSPRRISPNEKLNIGIIGAGGKGSENIAGVSSENIIAICDVDQKRGGTGFEKFPQARAYQDFRIMLE